MNRENRFAIRSTVRGVSDETRPTARALLDEGMFGNARMPGMPRIHALWRLSMLSNCLLDARFFRAPEAHLPTEEPDKPHRPPPPPVPGTEPPPIPAGDPPTEAPPERLR
jgi:hypothetical protein